MKDDRYINDFYAVEAKRKGYRARSVFKLEEIDKKYGIFRKGRTVLDLGAAPGSFMQYEIQMVGKRGLVVGIDLTDIEEIQKPNVHFVQGDIEEVLTEPKIVTGFLAPGEHFFDIITADLAPKTSGSKELDHFRSTELNETVFEVAKKTLKPGGYIISKMFEGSESEELIKALSKDFKKIKMFRPKASKRSRNEYFYVGKKK